MNTIFSKITNKNDPAIQQAGEILKNGGLVGIPTETVYGLAANALNTEAVKNIYKAKGRPSDNPLIVHISKLEQWAPLVKEIPVDALALAHAFWPGPLTIILKKSDIIPDETSGKLDTVAVRMPSNVIARAVIDASGVPLAAPSANTSGKPSPTNAKYVFDDLNGKIEMILDAGDCSVGVESTVITLATDKPKLLRPGGITPEMLETVLGEIEIDDAVYHKLATDTVAASPGMKYKHYAPKAEITLVKGSFDRFKALLEENKNQNPTALCYTEDMEKLGDFPCVSYGSKTNLNEQASRIFDALRELDEIGAGVVYARFPSMEGIGLAVYNRLIRAAAFRVAE